MAPALHARAPSRWPSDRQHVGQDTGRRGHLRARMGQSATAGRSCSSTASRSRTCRSCRSSRASSRERHRLVAYDLRGHGESAKPLDPVVLSATAVAGRTNCRRSSTAQGSPSRSSSAGRSADACCANTSSHYGDAAISGLQLRFVAAVRRSVGASRRRRKPTSTAARTRSPSASTRTSPSCAHASTASRPDDDFAVALAYNVIVPQEIREAISGWSTSLEPKRAPRWRR